MNIKTLLVLVLAISLAGCGKKKQDETVIPEGDGTYFSIKQFAKDQWDNNGGQPYTLQKTVIMNGKRDSSYVSAFNMEWGEILQTFFETDISDKKYLGHYNFSLFDEDVTDTRNYYYEAKDDNLYTKKLQISTDPVNNRILSIYIEAAKNSWWNHSGRKLYYSPKKVIQIQEFENPRIGPSKEIRIEYRF